METYTINEVAKILKASPSTIRRLLLCGNMGGFKVGADWRVTDQDLKEFVEANRPHKKEVEKGSP